MMSTNRAGVLSACAALAAAAGTFQAVEAQMRISTAFGGAGSATSTINRDFVELFNAGTAAQNLAGWTLQYASATGTTWSTVALTGTVPAGGYYLVGMGTGTAGSALSATPDVTSTIQMSNSSGKVALVNTTTVLSGTCPSGPSIVDFLGYGTSASCAEGTRTGNLSVTNAAVRNNNGCDDTNNNVNDFTITGTFTPRNSASPINLCGGGVLPPSLSSPLATPSPACRGTDNVVFTVTAAQGTPASAITAVLIGLTDIGGGAGVAMLDNGVAPDAFAGDGVFTAQFTPTAGTTVGLKSLPVTITDALSRTNSAAVALQVIDCVVPTSPALAGSAFTPGDVCRGNQTTRLTTTVTPGANPASTGIVVSADLTAFGLAANELLFDDGSNGDVTPFDNVYSRTFTPGVASPLGSNSVTISVIDDQSRTGSASASVTIADCPGRGQVVISQVYGGGGNTTAQFQNDFVELFNRSTSPVDVTGWSVQYGSATNGSGGLGSGSPATNVPAVLSGIIPPGGYYLVRMSAGNSCGGLPCGAPLPGFDATGTVAMSSSAGRIALVSNSTALGTNCGGTSIVDFVGYNSTAVCFEGFGPTGGLANNTAAKRNNGGCADTDDNSVDFTVGAPFPRFSGSPTSSCVGSPLGGSGFAFTSPVCGGQPAVFNIAVTPGADPASTGIIVTGDAAALGVAGPVAFFDDGVTGGDTIAGDNVFSAIITPSGTLSAGPRTVNFTVTDAQSRAFAGSFSVDIALCAPRVAAAFASPRALCPVGGLTDVVVTIDPATTPPSTGLTVNANLTLLGGSSDQPLFDDGTNGDRLPFDNTFTFRVNALSLSAGDYTIPVSGTDAESRTFSGTATLTILPACNDAGSGVVISQVYGGGGNTGTVFDNDFVELHNRTSNAVSLSGFSLQYASATGTFNNGVNLTGTIPAYGFYLVKLGRATNATGAPLPPADVELTSLNISATTGKVALVQGTTLIGADCADPAVRDLVGYGSSASCFEGAFFSLSPNNSLAIFRQSDGCQDNNQNAPDFFAALPNPRNTSAAPSTCPAFPLPPSFISGLSAPAQACPAGLVNLAVTVAPGSDPVSTGLGVTIDASAFGGGIIILNDAGTAGDAVAGDNVFGADYILPVSPTAFGAFSLPVNITDLQGRTGSGSVALNVANCGAAGTVVVSQIYGGGGNSGATFTHDFVELFNRSTAAVNVSGWSLQYASSSGDFTQGVNLTGTIPAGGYYLVQFAAGTGGTTPLPTPDATSTIAMSATSGRLALVSGTALIGANCADLGIVDLASYGSTVCFEGSGPAVSLSNTTAAFRVDGGCTDTNDNATDFFATAPDPRNSASPTRDCSATPPTGFGAADPSPVCAGSNLTLTIATAPGSNPVSTGLAVVANLTTLGGSASQAFADDGLNGDVTAGDGIFTFVHPVPATLSTGSKTVTAVVSDAQTRNTPVVFTATVERCSPTANALISPAVGCSDGGETTVVIAVNPATFPPSTGLSVTADLSALGGSPMQMLFDDGTNGDRLAGDNTFSFTQTFGALPAGPYALPFSGSDLQSRTFSGSGTLTVLACSPSASSVVVSQLYGGGGNTGAPLTNDYIELFNRSSSPVDITGWSVQYASSTGNFNAATNLSGIIPPGGYYLVQQGAGNSCGGLPCGVPGPTADATGSIAMSATSGKIALVNTTTLLGTAFTGPSIVDFVGYGTAANAFEGSAAALGLNNGLAAFRLAAGCTDRDENGPDFNANTPAPRNSASPANPCASTFDVTVTVEDGSTSGASALGQGFILSDPAGINCNTPTPGGPACTAAFAFGSTVTLTADVPPDSPFYFAGWSGDCTGFAPCVLTVDANKTAEARFTCKADFNQDGTLNDDDLGEFITAYFEISAGPGGYARGACDGADAPYDTLGYRGDFTNDCSLNDDDLGAFITAFFNGCPE